MRGKHRTGTGKVIRFPPISALLSLFLSNSCKTLHARHRVSCVLASYERTDVAKKVFNQDDAARGWFSHVRAVGYETTEEIVRLFEKSRSFAAETYRTLFTSPFWSGIIESSTGNISSFIPCRFLLVSSENPGWTIEEAFTLTRSSLVID